MRRSLRMSFLARGRRSLCAALPLVTPFWPPPPRDVGLFVNSEIHCAGAVENEKKPVEGKEQKNRIPS